MKNIYSILTQIDKTQYAYIKTKLSPRQRDLFNAILEEISEGHYPKFGYYVQKLYNMLPSDPKFRRNYQALFGVKKSLYEKLKEIIIENKQKFPAFPPNISPEWKAYLWARHLYSELKFQAANHWIKKAIFYANKENDINMLFNSKMLYYFISDTELHPPMITQVVEDYNIMIKALLVNFSSWLINVYKPYAYHQERVPSLLKKYISKILNLKNILNLPQDTEKWILFIKSYADYLDNVIMNEYPDENLISNIVDYLENFLIKEQYHKFFPTPSKITEYMLKDMIITFNIRTGNIKKANDMLKHEIDTIEKENNPYYERFLLGYAFTTYILGDFKRALNFTNKVLKNINKFKDELLIRHIIAIHYSSILFLGNWKKEQERELINFIHRSDNVYNTYGRQLRLRDQALFFFHKKDYEGLEVVIKTYRNSYSRDKKWDAIYDFCFILYKTLELKYTKNKEPLKKKIIRLIEKYGDFPKTSAWVRNHHNVFLRNKILKKLQKK